MMSLVLFCSLHTFLFSLVALVTFSWSLGALWFVLAHSKGVGGSVYVDEVRVA